MSAVLTPAPAAIRRRAVPSRPAGGWHTPDLLRALLALVVVAALATGVAATAAVSGARSALNTVGHRGAPGVLDAQDIYFSLADMDAQAANLLLVGDRTDLGITRAQARSAYAADLSRVTARLVSAAARTGDGPAADPVRGLLTGLAAYQVDTARADLLAGRADHAGALTAYRAATDLMHAHRTGLLAEADALNTADVSAVDHAYTSQESSAAWRAVLFLLAGSVLIGGLAATQVYLARHSHRAVSPALAVATIVSLALVAGAFGMLRSQSHHLTVAKKDAFDSILVLSRARAVAYDANGEESRFLLDPAHAVGYQRAFLADTAQIVSFVPPAGLGDFDTRFGHAVTVVSGRGQPVGFGGLFGVEMRNITFTGERDAAVATLHAYAVYQADDQVLRADAARGDTGEAIRFDTSSAPRDSNGAFYTFDTALGRLLTINVDAFHGAVSAGDSGLRGWSVIPLVAILLVVVLTVAGMRPRLAEYRV